MNFNSWISKFSLVALMLAPAHAIADWDLVASSDGKYDYFLDQSTVRDQDQVRLAWVMKSYYATQTDDSGALYRSSKTLLALKCSELTYGIKYITLFKEPMGRGSLVFTSQSRNIDEIQFTDAVPETMGHKMLSTICSID